MKKKPATPTVLGTVGALSGMGFTIAIPIVLGVLVGRYLDGLLNTRVLFLLLGLLLGLIAGIVGAFRLYKAVFKS
jgi:ATP synthase protein I